MADFRPRTPNIDPQAFANVLQRKAAMEQEQANIDRQRKDSRLGQLLQAVQSGQSIANNMLNIADKRGEMKRKQSEDEGKAEVMRLINTPLVSSDFEEPSLDPKVNAERLAVLKAERSKALEAAFAKADFDTYSKSVLSNKFQQHQSRAGDRSVEALELPNGKVVQVIVDKGTNEVFTLSGNKLSKAILDKSQKGFAPQIVEDLEGRKTRVSRGNSSKETIFGEQTPPTEGKETRIQFTPEERKAIIEARKEFSEHPFIKKTTETLPQISALEDLISKNPKGAMGIVQSRIPRQISNEVGVLTDRDVERNSPTPDIAENAKQWLKKVKDGDFTDVTRERYGILLKIVQAKQAEEAGKILDEITTNTTGFDLQNPNYTAVRKTIGRGTTDIIDRYTKKESDIDAQVNGFFNSLLGK